MKQISCGIQYKMKADKDIAITYYEDLRELNKHYRKLCWHDAVFVMPEATNFTVNKDGYGCYKGYRIGIDIDK